MSRGGVQRLALALLLLAGAGCASDSQQDLAEEAARLAPLGTTAAAARAAFTRAGFACRDGSDIPGVAADVTCSRERSHRLLATCVHRVMLSLDDARQRITRLQAADPTCASF